MSDICMWMKKVYFLDLYVYAMIKGLTGRHNYFSKRILVKYREFSLVYRFDSLVSSYVLGIILEILIVEF